MITDTSLKRSRFTFIASLALLGVATLYPLSSSRADKAGCTNVGGSKADLTTLINSYGQKDFQNPLEVTPTSEAARLELKVDYATITVTGCQTNLKTYNGGIVGPTIRAKPGDTIHVRLINKLKEPGGTTPTPQQPEPAGHGGGHNFNFNITNLHTHGLHVAPQGPVVDGKVPFESDNVMIEIRPQQTQDYRFVIPQDHPAGTFWYHAHVHGSTAVQLASGMEGALILDGGTKDNGELNTVPVIGKNKANEKILVMQQLQYNKDGTLDSFNFQNRPTLVNGLLVPVIHMRPGEVQRWRFIHGGIQENVALALDGHPLYEVAADGISLGRSVPWAATPTPDAGKPNLAKPNNLFFFPGNRSDVLVQAKKTGGRIFLRKLDLPAPVSIQAQQVAFARAAAAPAKKKTLAVPPVNPNDFTPGQILAELVVEGDPVADQLPTADELKDVVPKELVDIKPEDLNGQPQTVEFSTGNAICNAVDGSCVPCSTGPNCIWSYQVNRAQFAMTPKNPVLPKLNTAATWTVSTNSGFHPFHIHVNPFEVDREEPDATGAMVKRSVWKDTLAAVPTKQTLRTRYTDFIGTFVMHCHILTHEDQGMMELVQIVK